MSYLVFSQQRLAQIANESDLRGRIERLFGALIELGSSDAPTNEAWKITLTTPGSAERLEATLLERPLRSADLERATLAEQRGNTPGMAALAQRAQAVWVLELSDSMASTSHLGLLLGVLAHLGLGPILPPDTSTLLGVRSALKRSAR